MSLLRYILEVIICSGLFLVFYRWLIAKKVGFRLSRIYLVVTMLLSATIPAMNVPVYTQSPESADTSLAEILLMEEYFVRPASEAEAAAEEHYGEETEEAVSANVPAARTDIRKMTAATLATIYVIAALSGLGLIALNAVRIARIRRRSVLTRTEHYTLAEHEDIKTPFSFIRTIFMGFNYESQERSQILTHEASHVRHRHSYERLFMSVLRSVFWFNPFFWMAEKDLEEVQEWEADKDVLAEGWSLKTYRTTIFKQLFGYNPDITCGLNHSLTKQRFIMMTQSHRGKGAWLRLAATLPVIAATFFAFGCVAKQAKANEIPMDLTDGTDATYMEMCPPCDATASNTFGAGGTHSGIHFEVRKDGEPVDPARYFTSDRPERVGSTSRNVEAKAIRINFQKAGIDDNRLSDTYTMTIDGQSCTKEEVKDIVTGRIASDSSIDLLQISADPQTPMGYIDDLKMTLRGIEGLRIYFTLNSSVTPNHPATEMKKDEFYGVETYKADRRNILVIKTNATDRYLILDRPGYLDESSLKRLKEAIVNKEGDPDSPDRIEQTFTLPDGSSFTYPVPQAMVVMQHDRGTSFDGYQDVNDFVQRAYRELRDELAREVFAKPLAELTDSEKRVISQAIPMNVSEIAPKDSIRYKN